MNRDTVTAAPRDSRLAVVGRRLAYAVLLGNLVLALLYYRGHVHPVLAGLLYWASGATLVVAIRRVETATHPEQRGWWTWLPLLLGTVGLLSWLRHLDREH